MFTDVTGPKEEVTVRPVEDQGEWESRALWLKVAKGIRESDFETAARETTRIEVCIFSSHSLYLLFPLLTTTLDRVLTKKNEQRQRRRDEAAEGTTWELKHFVHQDDDPLCRSFFFIAACFMSHSQTKVWASSSR